MKFLLVVFSMMAVCASSEEEVTFRPFRMFPEGFMFGAASSAYQTEGAWNISGKGEHIWDYMTHTFPNRTMYSNADIGPDTYHNYKRDVEMMRELRLDAFRLSLSWTRLLPSGLLNHLNKDGVTFYNNYIDEMLKYNITPIVTLFDMDLPLFLHEHGGFTNVYVIEWFERYARLAYVLFGNRVKHWITFANPKKFCSTVYGKRPPGPFDNSIVLNNNNLDNDNNSNETLGVEDFNSESLCVKNVLLAHSKAYKAYKRDYQPVQKGVCGISVVVNWYANGDDHMEHVAQVQNQAEWGIFTDPIFSAKGGFPKLVLKDQVYCSICGMPKLTEKERKFIRGSSDFLAIDTYIWSILYKYYARHFPTNIYYVVKTLSEMYQQPDIFITTGLHAPPTSELSDDRRIQFLKYIFHDSIEVCIGGFHVRGLFIWSLMDSFEWQKGYSTGYGLYYVNYSDPRRTRTARKSAFYYKYLTQNRMIDYDYVPKMSVMKIGPLDT